MYPWPKVISTFWHSVGRNFEKKGFLYAGGNIQWAIPSIPENSQSRKDVDDGPVLTSVPRDNAACNVHVVQ